jgi:hypothetical protein
LREITESLAASRKNSMQRDSEVLSIRAQVKTPMTITREAHVFQHGRRWEITDVNSIDLVRQRGGRRSIPRVLSVHDMRLVLGELTEPYHTMVLIAACLGLRASEIMVSFAKIGSSRSH